MIEYQIARSEYEVSLKQNPFRVISDDKGFTRKPRSGKERKKAATVIPGKCRSYCKSQ